MQLLDYDALKNKGVTYSKTQLWRLAKAGTFPKPIKVGAARNAWVESEIDAWIKARMAERDSAAAECRPRVEAA